MYLAYRADHQLRSHAGALHCSGGCLRRPIAVVSVPLGKAEGGEAPRGAGADRRTSWPALRSGRSL